VLTNSTTIEHSFTNVVLYRTTLVHAVDCVDNSYLCTCLGTTWKKCGYSKYKTQARAQRETL